VIYFNYDLLSKMLNELAVAMGVNVQIFDEDFVCTRACSNTRNLFCDEIKVLKNDGCKKSDNEGLERAKASDHSFNYKCHFGLVEFMIKEMVDSIPIYITIGPFADPNNRERDIERINEYAKLRHKDPEEYIHYYNEMPLYTEEKFNAIVSITKLLVEHAKEKKIIAIKEDFFESDILPFLKENISKNYSISELCNIFAIPSKKFHSIIKKATGLSPKQLITKLKIDKAYEEIVLTRKELQQIAFEVGFEDYNYFIKLFKSIKGHTPKYFRQEQDGQEK